MTEQKNHGPLRTRPTGGHFLVAKIFGKPNLPWLAHMKMMKAPNQANPFAAFWALSYRPFGAVHKILAESWMR